MTPRSEVATAPATLNRRRFVSLGLAAAGVTGVGMGASRWVRSPEQLIADQQAPSPTTLTATVERRVLTDTVVVRGQVGAPRTFEVTPAARDSGRAVVTGVRVAPGQEIAPGAVLLEVAGRPLLALPGEIPAYRDLRPGATGRDVAQLQAALRSLSFDPAEPEGTLGPGTKRALSAFYESTGYPVLTEGDGSSLTATRDRVRDAERAVDDAEAAVADARVPRDIAAADTAGSPVPAPSEDGGAEADGAAAATPARSTAVARPVKGPSTSSASSSRAASGDPVAAAQRQLRYAGEDRDAARASLVELERTSGPMVPLSEIVFLPSFPARVVKSKASVGADVSAPLITLSSGELAITARLNPSQRQLLSPGAAVAITSEVLGTSTRGVVASIGDLATDERGERGHVMVVEPTDGPFDPKLSGQDVRLSLEAASTGAEVLVVPVSAIFAGADGQTAVLRQRIGGDQERVTVTVGVSGDGFVAVTPTSGSLDPGERVVVGAARSDPAAPDAPETRAGPR
jgi:HlyD family secretion protein